MHRLLADIRVAYCLPAPGYRRRGHLDRPRHWRQCRDLHARGPGAPQALPVTIRTSWCRSPSRAAATAVTGATAANCRTRSTHELRDHNDVFAGMLGRFAYSFHIGPRRANRTGGRRDRDGKLLSRPGRWRCARTDVTAEDDKVPGGHPVAVIGYGFWVSGFATDPGVLNSSLVINGHPYTVVGVARRVRRLEVGRPARVFVPMMMKAQLTPGWNALDQRLYRWVRVFARLRPRVTAKQAQAGLSPWPGSLIEEKSEGSRFARRRPKRGSATPRTRSR